MTHAIASLVVFAVLLICTASAAEPSENIHVTDELSHLPQQVFSEAVVLASRFWDVFKPGGQFHPESFIENKGHLVLEGLLIAVISYLFLQKSFNPKAQRQQQTELTEQVCCACNVCCTALTTPA